MGDLVTLRPVTEDDLSWLASLRNSPAASGVHEWHGWTDPQRRRRKWAESGLLGDDGGTLIVRHDTDRVGHVSLQAVYEALHALTAAGLVRRIEPAGSPARFERRVGDNHHHVVCRSCGVVADVDCAVGEIPCLTASDDHGFVIDEAEVIYWGLCPDCSTATSS